MAGQPLVPLRSLGSVRRAGDVSRRAQDSRRRVLSVEDVREAREVVEAYRSACAAPSHAAYMGLRSCPTPEGFSLDVLRRLKRLPTIEEKLQRLPRGDSIWSKRRPVNASAVSSRPAQMRDTSDLEMPDSAPSAATSHAPSESTPQPRRPP